MALQLGKSYTVCLNCINSCRYVVLRRFKHKRGHWSYQERKQFPVDRALEHFDDFYKTVYGGLWPSIRLALLSPHKYCAVVNHFGDSEQTIRTLESIGAINLQTLLDLETKRIDEEQFSSVNSVTSKIFKLDEHMGMLSQSKQQEELESLYPHKDGVSCVTPPLTTTELGQEGTTSTTDTSKGQNISLQASLKEAEYDEQRIIDPDNGLSAAALYEFVPATRLKGMEDWVTESQHYAYYGKDGEFPVRVKSEEKLNFPEHLKVYTFDRGNTSSMPSPKRGSTGVLGHYLLDGGSILPVLALDLNPGDKVLDMCAAPGGKSLIILQTLYPDYLVCNDVQESRTNRIRKVMRQYLYNMDNWKRKLFVTQSDGRAIEDLNQYNKVLVDVPCTTDRHVLHENDNNIFKPSRTKERLKLPETQAALLYNALRLVSQGGSVVYSTCSLSPIQNDGVVHMALKKLWEETNIEVEVRNLAPALGPARCVFKFGDDVGLRYGHIVLPFLPCNFGPMYFCKLVRKS